MTDKEKIRKEVERRMKEGYDAYAGNLKSILSFIDSLPKFNIGDTIRDPEDSEFTFHINKIEDGKYIEKDDAWVMIGLADEIYELVEKQWKPVPKREPTGVLKELLDNIDEKELEETRKEMMEELSNNYNTIKQERVCLEEIAEVLNKFEEEVFNVFGMVSSAEHTCEVQRRGIGINFAFGEEIHRSDDEITYYLKDDKLVAFSIIRRTEFNNAEITMVKTEERQFKFKRYD